jgi:two-component system alkaline phosphatase synthesis response regulator PhoP
MDILVADDEPFIQRSLSFVLKKEGFEVGTADNGQEALNKAKEYSPKIIFLDVMMPQISGFNVCSAIKSDSALKGSYVIILTAKGQEMDRETGLRMGADEFMTKPFSPREVVEKVRKIMGL